MEEETKITAAPAAEEKPAENRGYEPHGSVGAPRPGDRKDGSHRGRPSERRGGRGGFRREGDDLQERVVAINRVSKTVQGGKHVRFSALAVVGDGKGSYGFATAKSGEVPDAIKKALEKARKSMVKLEIVKGDTIAHDTVGCFGSTKVVLKPATPGTGVVAGGPVRAILELAGVKNVVSKVYGSRAPINVIRATDAGLRAVKSYDKVMVLRGKKTEEEIRARKAPKAAPAPKGDE
ncbi:MAG: 30S ribosomal protein S5 [Bacilli bacterium]|nr:30S ribosomal protein S5 [Bacilli bacterium]